MGASGIARVTVKVYLGATLGWVDITGKVRLSDRIKIEVGKADEAGQTGHNKLGMKINNRNGWFSPTNVDGPWWGLLDRGTPIWVYCTDSTAVDRTRFFGQIDELPTRWDPSGHDCYLPLTASSITKGLGLGLPIVSPARDAIALQAPAADLPVAYWPGEDPTGSSSLAAMVGGSPLAVRASVEMAKNTDWAHSGALPVLGFGGQIAGPVPTYTSASGAHSYREYVGIPSDGWTAVRTIAEIRFASGTLSRAVLDYDPAAEGTLFARVYNSAGTLVSAMLAAEYVNGMKMMAEMSFTQVGAAADLRVDVVHLSTLDNANAHRKPGSWDFDTDTLAATTLGRISTITIGPNGDLQGLTVGHIQVGTSALALSAQAPQPGLLGFPGEAAEARIDRLLANSGLILNGYIAAGELLGVQTATDLLAAVRDAAKADGGLLADSWRVQDAMEFYPAAYMSANTTPALILNQAAGQVPIPPEPLYDDQGLTTISTVSRPGGGTAVYDSGSTIGPYPRPETLNLASDLRLAPAAQRFVALGAPDAVRIPNLPIPLHDPDCAPLRDAWLVTQLASWVRLANPSRNIAPQDVDFILLGWTESIGKLEWDVTLNLTPAGPWRVGLLEAAGSRRLDTASSDIAAPGYNATATSLSVRTLAGPRWTVNAADMPFDVLASTGEKMTVTAISGTSSPQTFTVTRSRNGVVKPLPTGAAIRLADPFILARGGGVAPGLTFAAGNPVWSQQLLALADDASFGGVFPAQYTISTNGPLPGLASCSFTKQFDATRLVAEVFVSTRATAGVPTLAQLEVVIDNGNSDMCQLYINWTDRHGQLSGIGEVGGKPAAGQYTATLYAFATPGNPIAFDVNDRWSMSIRELKP